MAQRFHGIWMGQSGLNDQANTSFCQDVKQANEDRDRDEDHENLIGWNGVAADGEQRGLVEELLALEDELHPHLRAVTMGYLVPQAAARKSDAELEAYAANGPEDAERARQVEWWRDFGAR